MDKTFTLTISPDYVKNWTEQDAIREFIQNWIDQRNQEPEAGSAIKSSKGCLIIDNNFSVLQRQTLLLGGGTKAEDTGAIGGFGEGYKIALLVLTRLGFKVSIANYGLGELWEPQISYSHEYGTDVLKITCRQLQHGKNLQKGVSVIITKDSYDFDLIMHNIYLEKRDFTVIAQNDRYGQILDKSEAGRIYIGGLYISTSSELLYGYNFNPGILEIGRDRNITDTFQIRFKAPYVFQYTFDSFINQVYEDLKSGAKDFDYIDKYNLPEKMKIKIKDEFADKQVISSQSDKQVLEDNNIKVKNPIVVHKVIRNLIWEQPVSSKASAIKPKSTLDLLREFLEDELSNLSKRQVEKLNYIINRK